MAAMDGHGPGATVASSLPVGLLLVPTSDRGRHTLDRVVEAAVAVFGGAGDRRPSVAAVAEAVDISPAAVYQYFPDREALVLAAVERDVARLVTDALAETRARGESVLGGGFIAASERLSPEHPLAARAVAVERRDVLALPQVRAAFDEVRDVFTAELARAQQAGVVRGDVAPERLSDALTTASVYTMWAEAVGPGTESSPTYSAVVEVMRAALFHPVPDLSTPAELGALRQRVQAALSEG